MSKVSVKYQQDSMEKNFPCYESKLDDNNWMHLVHDTEEDKLWISHIWTEGNGQFKQLMNTTVRELDCNDIVFTMVLPNKLVKALDGFKKDRIMHEKLNEMMTVLKGKWRIDKE